MTRIRPRDRLDRRLAARRLRGRHLRAVARSLAAEPRVGALTCRDVWAGRRRRVRIGAPGPGADASVVSLALDLCTRGAARRAEQLLAAWTLAADGYAIYRTPALRHRDARPLLVATGGRVASGKSTLAKALARRMAIPRVVADRVRDVLRAPLGGAAHEIAWSQDFVARVYDGVLARAEDVLASGRSVVVDACFARAAQRRDAAARAERLGARFVFLHCDAPQGEIAARLARRDARGGGGWQVLAQTAPWEPLAEDEPGHHLRVERGRAPVAWLRALEGADEARA